MDWGNADNGALRPLAIAFILTGAVAAAFGLLYFWIAASEGGWEIAFVLAVLAVISLAWGARLLSRERNGSRS